MSLSLGEKLRQAREERGFTLSDVAEQTRISGLYLESIENDDYRILPGGIFNKGFVKSYAKFVGISEAEALSDYTALIAQTTKTEDEDSLKVYRPEVLTDDRSGSSMVPTVILAVVILGVMTAGILFLVDYLRRPAEEPSVAANTKTNTNTAVETVPESTPATTGGPEMASLKVEFKALNQPVLVTATLDGTKSDVKVSAGTAAPFEPKESLTLNYNRWNAQAVQLTINGKAITLPAVPLNPKDKRIEFTINKDNLAQIWSSGAISTDVPAVEPVATDVNANTVSAPTLAATPVATPTRVVPTPKPTVAANAATNTAPRPTPERRPAATPAAQPEPPTANRP